MVTKDTVPLGVTMLEEGPGLGATSPYLPKVSLICGSGEESRVWLGGPLWLQPRIIRQREGAGVGLPALEPF